MGSVAKASTVLPNLRRFVGPELKAPNGEPKGDVAVAMVSGLWYDFTQQRLKDDMISFKTAVRPISPLRLPLLRFVDSIF